MPAFTGTFEIRVAGGSLRQQGSCRIEFDEESFRLIPGAGAGAAFDLGDINAVAAPDYHIELRLYDGTAIRLLRLGPRLQNLRHDLLESWRRRLVRCLLIDDRNEVARVDGVARLDSESGGFSAPAEIRLYAGDLAVLPESGAAFHIRLADIDAVDFDQAAYAVRIAAAQELLVLTKLAGKTREFLWRLRGAAGVLAERSARVVSAVFPFLSVAEFQQIGALWKEGHAVAVERLAAIHPSAAGALERNCVDRRLRPYFGYLKERASGLFAGFQFVRREEDGEGDEAAPEETGGAPEEEDAQAVGLPLVELGEDAPLFWFFFPLRSAASRSGADVAAWECASLAGRATYFFRLPPAGGTDEAVGRLSRAAAALNFRREPVYLADRALELEPRFRCYAIACRRIPLLRELRDSFCGRVLHTSLSAWQRQVDSIVAQAR